MKIFFKILLSVFFLIAIGFHIPPIINFFPEKIILHLAYIFTYSICWGMLFSKNKNRSILYVLAAIFPFVMHVYYGYLALPKLNQSFWICLLVVIMLPIGYMSTRDKI
jgi:hypothetical protein